MIQKYVVILILGLLGLYLISCSTESQSKNPDEADSVATIPVEIGEVTRGDVSAFFYGTATLEAQEEATVVSEVGGIITEILVEEGDRVEMGQVLARIEQEPYEIELARAQASLNRLQNEFDRNRTMFERNLVSAETYESVKFELEVQRANLNLAKRNHEHTVIRAPIPGVVSERMIKTGNRITPNQPAFHIIQFETLLAILYVPEHEIGKIRPGQSVNLSIDARQGNRYTGRVERISPVVDRATGTARVTVLVNDRTGVLKPGMFARVNIVHDVHKNTLIIPKQAIISEDGRISVFFLQDSIAIRRRLVTGYTNGDKIEILEGLMEGDKVVTVGQASLRDSSRVEIISYN